ncbi:hypothetical protein BDW59DRAFT_179878 [Aspergillus cavernicola]|uniref:TPR-like protein n=1 Tax=Aspergillus cavernicola TaxID=176166 RepID=A0ABR4IC35_9EURO
MADSSNPKYPASLNTLFDETLLKDQYDPIRLEDGEIRHILELPLAKEVFGHSHTIERSLDGISRGEISYTQFVGEKTKALVSTPIDGLSTEQQMSQLFYIGLAALFAFLQSNVTGPPLEFKSTDVIIPSAIRSNAAALRTLRDKVIRDLSVDGEAAFKLTPSVELFAVAKAILVDADVLVGEGPLVARTTRMRVNFLHQKMLSEVTSTLQDVIYSDLDELSKRLLNEKSSGLEKGNFLLERATIHVHHGFDTKARADLEQAATERKFEFALTGRLGKRTKFQDRDISQLVILAKSAEEATGVDSERSDNANRDAVAPKKLDLNDDTLLEAISFTKPDEQQSQEKTVKVQEAPTLSTTLASLDPGDQPLLDPADSAILLSYAAAITNTRPEDGLTREETAPYATRVLDGGSSNWQIYTQGLLLRSRIEGYKSRTVERSVLQMQALVDQVLADTATQDTQATETSQEPSTFLPRPEKDESASAADRLKYIWLLSFSTRWDLESELANRWVNLGGLRTALDIYERLQMWAEVALCYAATEKEGKAKAITRRQLYEPTGQDPNDENEKFEGPELSPLPADAPRLFCILGDLESDPTLYDRAWEVSNKRYARAQRSLARHFLTLKPPALEKAAEAYQKSLHINRLNHGAWFALGCVQLELQCWDDAVKSFTRTVQLEDTDAEAWSNLAAAMLRTPEPSESEEEPQIQQPTSPAADDEETDPEQQPLTPLKDPHRRKREAITALHRAAQLKNTDARIWDNVLTVAASIPPPSTPFRAVIAAQRKVIELLGPKKGEKAIDIPILGMLVDHLITAYDYPDLLIEVKTDTYTDSTSKTQGGTSERVVRSGTIPGSILSLMENSVVPLITHSAPLWLLVSLVENFRERPSKALEAHEKAWRATVASSTQGAFQMGDEKRWMDIVVATERLVRSGYAKYGPMDKEDRARGEGGDGEVETEFVAKDWRFKAKSAVRGVMGKGKEFWEDTEGWGRLKELQGEVGGK